MRKYETMYLTSREKEKIEAINSRVKEIIEQHQGVFLKAEDWGTRQLAYPIKKDRRGTYVRLVYELSPDQVGEIDRVLKFQDGVVRFRTTLLIRDPSQPYEPPEMLKEKIPMYDSRSVPEEFASETEESTPEESSEENKPDSEDTADISDTGEEKGE